MGLVEPHGGTLCVLYLPTDEAAAFRPEVAEYPSWNLSQRQLCDLKLLLNGGFSPLTGFLGQADYESVLDGMRLADGTLWPIPVTLDVSRKFVDGLRPGQRIGLRDPEGFLIAAMTIDSVWEPDRRREAEAVFGTTDELHPGVDYLLNQTHPLYLGGRLTGITRPVEYDFNQLRDDPADLRGKFERWGWQRVVAFQTRNPMHRSHEYLAKVAIETCDGVLVHSLLGALKPGDIPAEVRTRAISVLIEKYFRPGTVVQAGYPLDMRYAGPREALLHALFRQNYGCSHQIVGRDHAGVGSYYGPFDAHRVFDEIPADALETRALKMDVTFWCYRCGGMASGRTCAHSDADRLQVSGTQLRKWLSESSPVPAEFSRPEVLEVLRAHYVALKEKAA
jgi:sulfate adenylyltransferase